MAAALEGFAQLNATRLETALIAAALPATAVVRTATACRDAAALPPLTLALGGRLHAIIEEIIPDIDLFDDRGPLGEVAAAYPANPAAMAGAVEAWADPKTVGWVEQHARAATTFSGLAESSLGAGGPATTLLEVGQISTAPILGPCRRIYA